MRSRALLLAGLMLAAPAAHAQAWREYDYRAAGFAIQFPAEPQVGPGEYRAGDGATAPATLYVARLDNAIYSVTVADLTKLKTGKDAAIAEAVKQAGETGVIATNVEERIDFEYGRELSVAGKDGSRALMAIFFDNGRLYQVVGKAQPPDAASGGARMLRFQQSLRFVPGEQER